MRRLRQFGELLVEARLTEASALDWCRNGVARAAVGINTGPPPGIAACLGIKPLLREPPYGGSEIDPAFAPFNENCELLSLGDPALTIALEFR